MKKRKQQRLKKQKHIVKFLSWIIAIFGVCFGIVFFISSASLRHVDSSALALPPTSNDPAASLVYGQASIYTSGVVNYGCNQTNMDRLRDVASDGKGGVYAADIWNNRVVHFPSDKTLQDKVYGQVDYTHCNSNQGLAKPSASTLYQPGGVTIDNSGNVYIADTNNNRVLYYPSGQTTATRVYGQPDFVSNGGGTSATSLSTPMGVAIDSTGNLYVADLNNNRVLYFPSGQTTATRVYGQPDFSSYSANQGGSPSANTLFHPWKIAVDSLGGLYVADTNNNRVLYYPTGQTTAMRVYGQPDFVSNSANQGKSSPSATTLNGPTGVTVDSASGVYISDNSNQRVLYYSVGSTTASVVFGQPDFVSNNPNQNENVSAYTLNNPQGITVDGNGGLYIADAVNTRILYFPNPPITPVSISGQTVCPGVTKNNKGVYQFAWLRVTNGHIVDTNNCIVILRGFNTIGTEYGNANGANDVSDAVIANFNQTFNMNLIRLNLNAYWWNTNPYVSYASMNYQDYIEHIISVMKQYGDYVELVPTTQFTEPPCSGGNSFCAPQDAGGQEFAGTPYPGDPDPGDPNAYQEKTDGSYINNVNTMWQSLVKLYAKDPAILYNAWNEMNEDTGLSDNQWNQNENSLINTIRNTFKGINSKQNPLIFLGAPNYNGNIEVLVSGIEPDFTQPDLVYDIHDYPQAPESPWYFNYPTMPNGETKWAQDRNHAVTLGEWGGKYDANPYQSNLINFVKNYGVALTFYAQSDVMDGQGNLTSIGQLVQQGYASLPPAKQ